jgi:four helix bundle protein
MIKLLTIYLNHFPKHEKYALCTQIKNSALLVFELIVEGEKKYQKKSSLMNLDIAHEKLRMYLRLAYELGYFRFKDGKESTQDGEKIEMHRFLAITNLNNELGKMIGGWIKKSKEDGTYR